MKKILNVIFIIIPIFVLGIMFAVVKNINKSPDHILTLSDYIIGQSISIIIVIIGSVLEKKIKNK
jgi:hypothetical protein